MNKLFCYLCNFTHPKTGFDLINKQQHIFIELKSNWNTDNHISKESKFSSLFENTKQTLQIQKFYICLNNKHKMHVNYTHHFGFQIITGMKAWGSFVNGASINVNELIDFIRALVQMYLII